MRGKEMQGEHAEDESKNISKVVIANKQPDYQTKSL